MNSAAAAEGAAYEPGVPSLRALLPSAIFGAIVPLIAFNVLRHPLHSEVKALIIAGVFPVAWVIVSLIRTRQVDFIGAVVVIGFALGVLTSTLLGGNAYVLKARDSAFTAVFGLACLGSIFTRRRPAIFFVGRYLSAGNDMEKKAAYDELHQLPEGQRVFRVLTIVWGIGLLIDASIRLILADSSVLPTSVFLGVSPVIAATFLASMFIFSIIYVNRARARGDLVAAEAESAAAAPSEPIPLP